MWRRFAASAAILPRNNVVAVSRRWRVEIGATALAIDRTRHAARQEALAAVQPIHRTGAVHVVRVLLQIAVVAVRIPRAAGSGLAVGSGPFTRDRSDVGAQHLRA